MMMASLIEPSSFDLIVVGTGLPECIVAAAAASSGHSVLHLDPCDFYGSHWASLPFLDLSHWSASSGLLPLPPQLDGREQGATAEVPSQPNGSLPHPDHLPLDAPAGNGILDNGIGNLDLHSPHLVQEEDLSLSPEAATLADTTSPEALDVEPHRPMYSDFQFVQNSAEDLGPSRSYSIDLAGPKLAFCGGPLVDLLLRSGASNYLEFKGLEASYIWTSGGLSSVPSSRADVFKDRTLSLVEKRYLMRFFKLVVDHASTGVSELSAEDLDAPFVELLRRQQLPSSIQAIILYAIAFANDDQDGVLEGHSSTISSREGLSSLALYLTSVGRFPNAIGAFLYPLYGQGELPQAFSRCAAVKGALYVLRMSVDALLRDKESHEFKGIRTSSGQMIFSQKLVTGPSLYMTLCHNFVGESRLQSWETNHPMSSKVVRSICITDKSLQPGLSTVMVIFPPRSVTAGSSSVIRALQLGSNASVCPEGKFLVQLSMVCSDGLAGIEALQAATGSLFRCQYSDSVEEAAGIEANSHEVVHVLEKPTLLWAVFYVQNGVFLQDMETWISPGHIAVFGMPDGTIDDRSAVTSAEKVFQGLFPEDVFFPTTVHVDNDDGVERGPGDVVEHLESVEGNS